MSSAVSYENSAAGPPPPNAVIYIDDGLVLGATNVAALRTLVNIAHRLSNVLGPSWKYVVEVLNSLDRILESPHARAEDDETHHEDETPDTSMRGGPSEVIILATAINQLFETSMHMSSDATVSLLLALGEVSAAALPMQMSVARPRLFALSRMVDVMLYNLYRIQDLWGIFLAHVLEVLRSKDAQVRAGAIDALDRTITAALNPAAPTKRPVSLTPNTETVPLPVVESEGIENMMLVALDSLYREEREGDVRKGILRIVLHVLQYHGENVTRGWVPIQRLLEYVPTVPEASTIELGFQCCELISSDFLALIPKEYIARALDIVSKYAQQAEVMNVSLTAVTILWNATDLLARSRSNASAAAAAAHDGGGAVRAVHKTVASGRADLSEEECTEMLLGVFRCLKQLSCDKRPEVRMSGVRTLFLAVGSHAAGFSTSTWRTCLWELLFPLLKYIHYMSDTSSCEEEAAVELGKDQGRSVMMLMHHSRNTEQKQWDETLVLAVSGAGKLLRAHLPSIVGLDGFATSWADLMQLLGAILSAGRKGVCMAATNFIVSLLTAHGTSGLITHTMCKQSLAAVDLGVKSMAGPGTSVPIQARMELVNGVGSLYATLKDNLDIADIRLFVRWVDRFSRYPVGSDDPTPHHLSLMPLQKSVLGLLTQVVPVVLEEAWEEILVMMCNQLRPLDLLPYRTPAGAADNKGTNSPTSFSTQASFASLPPRISTDSATTNPDIPRTQSSEDPPSLTFTSLSPSNSLLPPSNTASADASTTGGACGTAGGRSSTTGGTCGTAGGTDLVVEARSLSAAWLTKIAEQLCAWFKDAAPWQVQAAMFPLVLTSLSHCMALKHIDPSDSLWRPATSCFISLITAGIPAVNIAHTQSHPVPSNTWTNLCIAFETYLLGEHLTELANTSSNTPSNTSSSTTSSASSNTPPSAFSSLSSSTAALFTSSLSDSASPSSQEGVVASDAELDATVLDCLADQVLAACQHAPREVKERLLRVLERGCMRSMPQDVTLPASSRFSQVSLRKLFVVCSRGDELSPSSDLIARSVLEVSQLALPLLVGRCETILSEFLVSERKAGGAAPAQADNVICVLEILTTMKLAPSVIDAYITQRPSLKPWVDVVRKTRHTGEDVSKREQTYLFALYGTLCECISCRDDRVRDIVQDVLMAVGCEMGLMGVNRPHAER